MSLSKPEKATLARICSRGDTRVRAELLLQSAKMKTGPGTGYDLGEARSGLAAICALLASEELGNGDVNEKLAQTTSCLHPKVFANALKTVRSSLNAGSNQRSKQTDRLTYETLIRRMKIGRAALMQAWMQKAEKILINSRVLDEDLVPPNKTVTLAVFCWVCRVVKIRKSEISHLHVEYKVARDELEEVTEAIDETCQQLEMEINHTTNTLRAERNAAQATTQKSTHAADADQTAEQAVPPKVSGTTSVDVEPSTPHSPSKSHLTRSPSKSAMRAPSVASSPTKTPSHKRKVAFSEAFDEEEEDNMKTPTRKKMKTSGGFTLEPLPPPSFLAAVRGSKTPQASSSRVVLNGLQANRDTDNDDDEGELIQEARTLVDPNSSIPTTPRKTRRSTLFPATPSEFDITPSRHGRGRRRATSKSKSGEESLASDEEEGGEALLPHRHRPILLSHKQWLLRDPRVVQQWKAAEAAKKSMIDKFGIQVRNPKDI
ncbi:hypothetical protein K474DRAFT_1672428 [Panus rudis PR-1116 ss-1]|nr:hypothetical protein K474DRAFT_1672428 [Panus rudis PR-1116 ss-1]